MKPVRVLIVCAIPLSLLAAYYIVRASVAGLHDAGTTAGDDDIVLEAERLRGQRGVLGEDARLLIVF